MRPSAAGATASSARPIPNSRPTPRSPRRRPTSRLLSSSIERAEKILRDGGTAPACHARRCAARRRRAPVPRPRPAGRAPRGYRRPRSKCDACRPAGSWRGMPRSARTRPSGSISSTLLLGSSTKTTVTPCSGRHRAPTPWRRARRDRFRAAAPRSGTAIATWLRRPIMPAPARAAPRMMPPVIGRGTPSVEGKLSGSAFECAHGEIGEGLRLHHRGGPADLVRRRDPPFDPPARLGQDRGIARPSAADDPDSPARAGRMRRRRDRGGVKAASVAAASAVERPTPPRREGVAVERLGRELAEIGMGHAAPRALPRRPGPPAPPARRDPWPLRSRSSIRSSISALPGPVSKAIGIPAPRSTKVTLPTPPRLTHRDGPASAPASTSAR